MDSFDFTYKKNYKRLFGLACKMLNDKEVANDIIQDVFVIYFQKLQQDYEISNPSSWLLRITINKCIDYSNHQKKFEDLDETTPITSSGSDFEKDEIRLFIKKALAQLKPNERALVLLYNDGVSYKDISEITEININSVGKTI
ncbi:MAG: sigma-70 family RNA polymerase sigma factor, partial [Bacteroidales bacterium]|nr:sigma-70 family RNA polymerase sigma factor [Bacteroidales bacterium]